MTSDRRKFTQNVGLIGLTNFLIVLKGIILLPIITKLLGTRDYGVWTQLSVTLSLLSPLILLGLPFSLVRSLASKTNRQEIQEVIYSILAVVFAAGSIIVLIFLVFSQNIGGFLQSPPAFIEILAFVILLECLNAVFFSVLRAFEEIKKYSALTLCQNFGEIGLVLYYVFTGQGLAGAVLALLLVRLAIFLTLAILVASRFGVKIPNFKFLRQHLHFGLPTLASNVSYWLVTSSDRYLIGAFLGVLFVGYYAPAYAIGNLLNFFTFPLGFLLPAALAKLFDENKLAETRTHLRYSLKYFLLLTIPSFFGLSFLAKPLLTSFSNPEIASQGYLVTPFVALSVLLYGATGIFAEILSLAKKTRIAGSIWTLAAFGNVGLNLLFVPKFGILGAAITTLLAYALAFFLTWYFSFKELKFQIDSKFILKSVLASVLMTILLGQLNPHGFSEIILAVVLGALLYGILIFFFKGIDKKELDFFKSFFQSYFARHQP
ncbi:MAG: polysaccharide biosynthesis C-terminal domain-containing protein [Candidatus Nealsonbacteria bacterium]|nr:polysaccharide biosynthesis C-terminal domain-containing protein [Candidatus Nealsonbacteria bacterium]